MLDVLHIFFDSLDVDGWMLLRAVVPLGAHRGARRVEVAAILTLLKEWRLDGVGIDLGRL